MLVQLFGVIVSVIYLQFQFEAPRVALLLLRCHLGHLVHLDRGYWEDILNHLLLRHHLPYILRLQWRCDHLFLLLLADDSVEAKLERLPVIFIQRQPLFLFVRNFLQHGCYVLFLWNLFLLLIFILEKL